MVIGTIIFTDACPFLGTLSLRYHEYKTSIPMLPITHGILFTKLNIVLYSLLIIASVYYCMIGMSGNFYLISVFY